MTCKEIIKNFLVKNGFDGLCHEECGCLIKDLAPCDDGPFLNCSPGWNHGSENEIVMRPWRHGEKRRLKRRK